MGELMYRTGRDVKRAWWGKALIQSKKDRAESGITVAEWCEQHHVSEKSYWYYHKMFGDELALAISTQEQPEEIIPAPVLDQTVFCELQEPTQSVSDNTRSGGATICKGDIRIEITDSISDEFLLRIMKAVSHV